jgi:hypothetical protein
MADFLGCCDLMLREMTCHDGLKELTVTEDTGFPVCAGCQLDNGSLCCNDCMDSEMYCSGCMVKRHLKLPLHVIKVWFSTLITSHFLIVYKIWNGCFFSPYTLMQARLIVQLGHDGKACSNSKLRELPLTVIDMSGIHQVAYALCGCHRIGASESIVQMMCAQWWPATMVCPHTVVSFTTLWLFHALTIQGKVNPYKFYTGLIQITDGAGAHQLKVSDMFQVHLSHLRCLVLLQRISSVGLHVSAPTNGKARRTCT